MSSAPLAEQLRPQTPDEVIGQQHLLGPGKPLRLAFESGQPHSMILWGPPGVGKTTLARMMATQFSCEFIALSAVFSGIKEVREAVAQAEMWRGQGRRTILFVDEIHRFNKAQQDGFLPFVESGLFTFIGATTENPSFEVNSALLSRASVYVLNSLDDAEMGQLFDRACARALADLSFDDDGARAAGRAGRRRCPAPAQRPRAGADRRPYGGHLSRSTARSSRKPWRRACAASTRAATPSTTRSRRCTSRCAARSPDGALYWFCRMLDGGADPRYLARRIVRMAWEDIGLADPRAMQIANDAAATYERLGSPEGELALAEAVIYLAVAAKSNAAYVAYNAARAFVKQDGSRPVPVHLRNAPTKLMKELGYGKEYRYAHDEPEAYAAGETYLPDGMAEPGWYAPTPRGLEGKIGEKLAHLRELDKKAKK